MKRRDVRPEPFRSRLSWWVVPLAVLIGVTVLAGCTAPDDDSDMDEDEGPTPVSGFEWGFDPATVEAATGQDVEIRFTNDGDIAHNLGGDFGRTDTISSGQTATLTVSFDEPGEHAYWCSVPGHREKGMEGTIVVG